MDSIIGPPMLAKAINRLAPGCQSLAGRFEVLVKGHNHGRLDKPRRFTSFTTGYASAQT